MITWSQRVASGMSQAAKESLHAATQDEGRRTKDMGRTHRLCHAAVTANLAGQPAEQTC